MPTATATPTQKKVPRTSYNLKVIFDYSAHSLKVKETVIYNHFASFKTLDSLVMVVEPNRKPGQFKLNQLTWKNGDVIKNYELHGARLTIPFQPVLVPDGEIGLTLDYEIILPERSGPFGYTLQQSNVTDWYPFIPPFHQDSGWVIHEPAAVGEHLVYDIASFSVEIELQNAPSGLLLAASAPVQESGGIFYYRVDNARNFSFSANEGFVHITNSNGPIPVEAYVTSEHIGPGLLAAQYTAAALTLFNDLYGPTNRQSLTFVEWKHPDGIEVDGMFFLNWNYFEYAPGGAASGLSTLIVHETAHQWWYASVGSDSALEPWLDEALSTFSEMVYYERLYPDLIDWWWGYRILVYNPSGSVNSTIYDQETVRSYVNAVYLRGALFLDELRSLIGTEPFMAFIKEYASQYQDQLASSSDFFKLLFEFSPVDLSPLLTRFFTAQS